MTLLLPDVWVFADQSRDLQVEQRRVRELNDFGNGDDGVTVPVHLLTKPLQDRAQGLSGPLTGASVTPSAAEAARPANPSGLTPGGERPLSEGQGQRALGLELPPPPSPKATQVYTQTGSQETSSGALGSRRDWPRGPGPARRTHGRQLAEEKAQLLGLTPHPLGALLALLGAPERDALLQDGPQVLLHHAPVRLGDHPLRGTRRTGSAWHAGPKASPGPPCTGQRAPPPFSSIQILESTKEAHLSLYYKFYFRKL